jgi:hypothetical protein
LGAIADGQLVVHIVEMGSHSARGHSQFERYALVRLAFSQDAKDLGLAA